MVDKPFLRQSRNATAGRDPEMHAYGFLLGQRLSSARVGAAPPNASQFPAGILSTHWAEYIGQSTLDRQCFVVPMTRSELEITSGTAAWINEVARAEHVKFVDIGKLQSRADGDRQCPWRRSCAPTPK